MHRLVSRRFRSSCNPWATTHRTYLSLPPSPSRTRVLRIGRAPWEYDGRNVTASLGRSRQKCDSYQPHTSKRARCNSCGRVPWCAARHEYHVSIHLLVPCHRYAALGPCLITVNIILLTSISPAEVVVEHGAEYPHGVVIFSDAARWARVHEMTATLGHPWIDTAPTCLSLRLQPI